MSPREGATVPGPACGIAPDLPAAGETVLLVDDDPSVRRVTARYLALLGYQVLDAADAGCAMARAQAASRIDVVVSDVAMPGVRGPELIRNVQSRWPAAGAVLMTGYASEAVHHADWPAGAVLLEKPFDLSRLRQALSACRAEWEDAR